MSRKKKIWLPAWQIDFDHKTKTWFVVAWSNGFLDYSNCLPGPYHSREEARKALARQLNGWHDRAKAKAAATWMERFQRDRLHGGWRKGEMVMIGASSGSGRFISIVTQIVDPPNRVGFQ